MEKNWHLSIFGLVQGISFRYETRKKAISLGLKGFVRNLDDGSVEIMVCGNESSVNKLQTWIESCPGWAKVEKIVRKDVKEPIEFDSFEILY